MYLVPCELHIRPRFYSRRYYFRPILYASSHMKILIAKQIWGNYMNLLFRDTSDQKVPTLKITIESRVEKLHVQIEVTILLFTIGWGLSWLKSNSAGSVTGASVTDNPVSLVSNTALLHIIDGSSIVIANIYTTQCWHTVPSVTEHIDWFNIYLYVNLDCVMSTQMFLSRFEVEERNPKKYRDHLKKCGCKNKEMKCVRGREETDKSQRCHMGPEIRNNHSTREREDVYKQPSIMKDSIGQKEKTRRG